MLKVIIIVLLVCSLIMYGIILGADKRKSDEEHERDDLEQMEAIKKENQKV